MAHSGDVPAWISQVELPPDSLIDVDLDSRHDFEFIVDTNGHLQQIRSTRHGKPRPVEEALIRSLRRMPAWHPAVLNGRKVQMYYRLPLVLDFERL